MQAERRYPLAAVDSLTGCAPPRSHIPLFGNLRARQLPKIPSALTTLHLPCGRTVDPGANA